MTLQAVILDVDGTLIDTNAAHVEAWRQAFRDNGHDVPAERIRPETGKGGDQLVPSILGADGDRRQGDAIRQRHNAIFLETARRQHFAVFPGVRELLAGLRQRGLRTALATSSKQDQFQAIQDSAGIDLRPLVDAVVTAADADASKPAPDLVESALKKLGLPPDACLFVGDTPHDVEASGRAGVACVGLTCGGCFDADALRGAGAVAVFRDPADLAAHLDELMRMAGHSSGEQPASA